MSPPFHHHHRRSYCESGPLFKYLGVHIAHNLTRTTFTALQEKGPPTPRLEEAETCWLQCGHPDCILQIWAVESILTSCITVWYGNRLEGSAKGGEVGTEDHQLMPPTHPPYIPLAGGWEENSKNKKAEIQLLPWGDEVSELPSCNNRLTIPRPLFSPVFLNCTF